jgi:Fur family transcriptional regulator, stress-responsive regulator
MTPSVDTLDRELTETLRSRGQRVTPQRLVLHRVLRGQDRHVTAEEAMRAVGRRLPNVSLPTVYATLELFEELGLVRRVAMEGGPTLFDSRTDDHNHVACRRCGRIEDIEGPVDDSRARRAARAAGYEPERTDVVVVGLCSDCRQ